MTFHIAFHEAHSPSAGHQCVQRHRGNTYVPFWIDRAHVCRCHDGCLIEVCTSSLKTRQLHDNFAGRIGNRDIHAGYVVHSERSDIPRQNIKCQWHRFDTDHCSGWPDQIRENFRVHTDICTEVHGDRSALNQLADYPQIRLVRIRI